MGMRVLCLFMELKLATIASGVEGRGYSPKQYRCDAVLR